MRSIYDILILYEQFNYSFTVDLRIRGWKFDVKMKLYQKYERSFGSSLSTEAVSFFILCSYCSTSLPSSTRIAAPFDITIPPLLIKIRYPDSWINYPAATQFATEFVDVASSVLSTIHKIKTLDCPTLSGQRAIGSNLDGKMAINGGETDSPLNDGSRVIIITIMI